MSRHPYAIRLLPLALSTLLAACATTAPPRRAPVRLPMQPPVLTVSTTAPASAASSAPAPAPAGTVWDKLRASFQMADCDDDPGILAWARRYTRNKARFEQQTHDALPKLAYIQQVAATHGVAGEFALLPWIESGYRPIPGHRGRPAGMWQIMPATAAAMGLRVNGRYDARLDMPDTAAAVMKLLSQYYEEFHDWRIVDYAYNVGEYKARQLVQRHGMPPPTPVIPRWPVHDITREHLTKLLAMACVVRQPERFGVSLPVLAPSQHLVKVELPHSMPLARAADRAGMSLDQLKDLNAALRNNFADTSVTSYLMMPVGRAQQFQDTLLAPSASNENFGDLAPSDDTAAETTDDAAPASDAETARQAGRGPRTHRVMPGDTLWGLARRYSVSVRDLRQWNNLRNQDIHPGQVLRISTAR